jgi:hypothetical protein
MKIGVVGAGQVGATAGRICPVVCRRLIAPHDHINVERIEFAPRQTRWVLSTAMRVEPEPRNGSMTAVTSCLMMVAIPASEGRLRQLLRAARHLSRGARTREIISQ